MKRTASDSAEGSGGWRTAADIARSIQRMTRVVQNAAKPLMAHGISPEQAAILAAGQAGAGEGASTAEALAEAAGLGWWVLAQGRLLDPDDFSTREAAREDLLDSVRKAGVLVGENVWVWDETGRAQLVLATLPTLERASKVAERLRAKGLNITVRREMPQQE